MKNKTENSISNKSFKSFEKPFNRNQNTILVTHSYHLRLDPKQWKLGQPYAPLGTLYAAALMREHGYKVKLHDSMFQESLKSYEAAIDSHDSSIVVLFEDGFNYLTKMCLTNMREAAFEMIAIAKSKNCKVIVSGPDATDRFEEYLHAGADFILLGEAEQTLVELIHMIHDDSNDFTSVKGLAFKTNDAIIKTLKRPVMKDLDSLPLPAWDLVDFEPYQKMWLKHAGYFSVNIGTTRGCPFKCNWCAKPVYGNRYNARSPKSVIDEIMFLKILVKFDHIWFCDDIFGLKPGWVNEFAELTEKHQLKLRFKIQSRADLLVQEKYVHDLARAGCHDVWMGAESGSQRILDAMDKGIAVTQIKQATSLLKTHNVRPCFFIQFGYLGETKKDIALTIKMINELLPSEIGISVSYPLPGTGFYEKVKSEMKEKTNWTDSDELALMFRNTYQPAFYKQLHRYVHYSYKTHMALLTFRSLFRAPVSLTYPVIRKALSAIYYAPAAFIGKMRLAQFKSA
jgi:anaerobic magnesium-protoporphyrin IX monomethyl ester cyclase